MLNSRTLFFDELNNNQRAAVENSIDTCTKIVAGAGTGKTKIISKRFVKLVFDLISRGVENPASKLLVITFTEKAAGEMKERILKELRTSDAGCDIDNLWISTFHGFCSRILRRHSIEVGLSPSFKLADEDTLAKKYDYLIRKIKEGEVSTIEGFDKISGTLGIGEDVLCVDKLTSLSEIDDIDDIFENIFSVIKKVKALGLSPYDFYKRTSSATVEYKRTLDKIPFGFSSKEEYITEWERVLRDYIDDFCQNPDDAVADIMSNSCVLKKNRSPKPEKWTRSETFEEAINKSNDLSLYLIKVSAIIYALYQNELEKADLADFDDLINKTVEVFKNNSSVLEYYKNYFEHIIIDEFQDTNGSQLELIKLLLKDESPNLTYVGDRKQSIYGFRYAQMENLDVLQQFVCEKYHKNYPEIKLDINYRSTPEVLGAVNYVTTDFLHLNECLEAYKSSCDIKVKNTILTGCQGAYDLNERQADYIASEILRLKREKSVSFKNFAILVKSHAQAEFLDSKLSKYGIPSVKRVNTDFFESDVVRTVLAMFRLAKNSFDELALIKILSLYLSDYALFALKKTVDTAVMAEVSDFEELKRKNFCEKIIFLKENNKFDSIEVENYIKNLVSKIFSVCSYINKHQTDMSLLQIFYRFVNEIKPYVADNTVSEYKSEMNLKILERVISDFMKSEYSVSIDKLLSYIERIKSDRNFELPSSGIAEVDAVRLLTVYASKGLEFPYVFVCAVRNYVSRSDGKVVLDLQYGNKPGFGLIITKLSGEDTPQYIVYKELWKKVREKNEELRLFYVALSRAEKYLNIIGFENCRSLKAAQYTYDVHSSVEKENIICE